MNNPNAMTIDEVCREYDISRATAYRHWRKWPHFMLGGRPRFNRSELTKTFSNEGRVQSMHSTSPRIVIAKRFVKTA